MDDANNIHLNENYLNKYNKIKKIGIGNFTEVWEAENKENKEKRAIKIIKLDDIRLEAKVNPDEEIQGIIEDLKNEINNMIICEENNINSVKYYEAFQTENEFVIVLELCEGSLSNLINQNLDIDKIYEILSQLNNTFKIMNKKKIVHRDLKPDNILIKKENNKNIIKLCDYGISNKIGKFTSLISHKGTNEYMAPEIMKGGKYNYKCDLWSLGIIIYELFFKKRPYKGDTEFAILGIIYKFGKEVLKETGDDLLDKLIKKLLEQDPENRPTWDEYLNDPFFVVNEIKIVYKILPKETRIRIFGKEFVENNSNKCKIKYKDQQYDLQEFFDIKNDEEKIELIITGINDITDMSNMFSECNSLESIDNTLKWNTNNVNNMSYMFFNCKLLTSLPTGISQLKTRNVTNMSYMFFNCKNIENLPDISKWDTNNVTDMSYMFYNCESLKSLPKISLWNTSNVKDMNSLFGNCSSLESLPDISNWNTINVEDIGDMFLNCESLETLPDINKWNIIKVYNKMDMFKECTFSLKNYSKFIDK